MKIKQLAANYESLLDSTVTVSGWVLSSRLQKEL